MGFNSRMLRQSQSRFERGNRRRTRAGRSAALGVPTMAVIGLAVWYFFIRKK